MGDVRRLMCVRDVSGSGCGKIEICGLLFLEVVVVVVLLHQFQTRNALHILELATYFSLC